MDIVSKLTDAWWLSARGSDPDHVNEHNAARNEVAYFRRSFSLVKPATLVLSISAHSRYRLWINGQAVLSGPCKGDRWRHYYETIDVSSYLTAGDNVLAVKVVAYSPYEAQPPGWGGPFSVTSNAAGPCLIASGRCVAEDGEILADLATGKPGDGWLVCLDDAVSWEAYGPTHFMGGMERVDGARLPRHWNLPGSAENGKWLIPIRRWKADGRPYGIIPPFPLMERPIPLLYETSRRFRSEVDVKKGNGELFSFIEGAAEPQPAVIPPHSKRKVVLDAGELMTGYIILPLSGGRGSRVALLYAESFSKHREGGFPLKGKRDDAMRYDLIGQQDVYLPSGGRETYEPFWFRTFRFMQIEVETCDEPLVIDPPEFRETGYPLDVQSAAVSSNAWIRPLWDVSVRTLQRCMHETYEDCPYYEQLQYAMDTRLQILFTYAVSGDSRLARRAIDDYHASLLPEGILQARYPCMESQVIPAFSLHWILMVEDYYWQTGDPSVAVRYRATIDSVLDWYDRKLGPQGLVHRLGYWEFIDWVEAWDELHGAPTATLTGPSTIHNLLYVYALQSAARLSRLGNRFEIAHEYEARAGHVLQALQQLCWSESSGLYREGPECEQYSQHAQVWAVLTGLASGEQGRKLIRRMMDRDDLLPCSYAMSFYLFRAIEKVGLYEETEQMWKPWRDLLELNLTTWPEDPFMQRSDCHGWGALPLYEFTRCLLGVKPGAPGWETIRIEPHCLSLQDMRGQAITPKGTVRANWFIGDGVFHISGESPEGAPLLVAMPDGSSCSMPQGGAFRLSCPVAGNSETSLDREGNA
ncbi:family 78 glycoside hydrolase catalytic domain [Paenibacillus sp. VMFN-D1]|uniref:family 78 glycoside hydrolase catalytic domain n=1 Tax=Paenibacillus sp. VMFN-D1 TaxID=2135608 RepID=UPI000E37F3F9|nr:family 78 glycoside hydrolase catalytic domain [Paenibacillus sp. VMFN-D1]RED39979.1 alpha-L-rhamnosidase-like protein [Paenibacillus sp. VMFN-D1]